VILAEAEAATKWCPFARQVELWQGRGDADAVAAVNRYDLTDSASLPRGALCIGSRCMAWQWLHGVTIGRNHPYRTNPKATEEPARPDAVPDSWTWVPFNPADADTDDAHWLEDEASVAARRQGFCGLAYAVRLP
jgi:hypothetical protein